MTGVNLNIRRVSILIIAIILFLTVNVLQAADANIHENPDSTYPLKLYQQQDYYRAATEILRMKFFFPKESAKYKLDQYLIKSYYEMDLYVHAEKTATQLLHDSNDYFDKQTRVGIAMLLAFSQLKQDKYQLAKKTWRESVSQDMANQPPSYENIPDRINPAKARLLSSIIPGTGLILSQQYGSAIVSFLINVVFIAGSYHYLNSKQYGVASLLLFFEIGWYTGGKKAAYEAAENYNYSQLKGLRQKWIESQKLTF